MPLCGNAQRGKKMYTINYYYTSNVGRCRSINQDNFYCNGKYMPHVNNGTDGVISDSFSTENLTTIGIFDGMGGEEQGEMAAHLAAKELAGFKFGEDMASSYSQYCKQANAEICKYTVENSLNCMGTTAALLSFKKGDIWLFNIGDSKIFEVNAGVLKQISVDHVSIAPFGRKPPLSQSLGIPEDELMLTPNIQKLPCKKGYQYLISSDGLTDMLTVAEIEEILRTSSGKDSVEKLLAKALENGGKDNVTIVLAEVVKKDAVCGLGLKNCLLIGGAALLLLAAVGVGAYMLFGKDDGGKDDVSGELTSDDATTEDSSSKDLAPKPVPDNTPSKPDDSSATEDSSAADISTDDDSSDDASSDDASSDDASSEEPSDDVSSETSSKEATDDNSSEETPVDKSTEDSANLPTEL